MNHKHGDGTKMPHVIYEGMEHRMPSAHDSSMAQKGGHVDDAATRTEPGKQPKAVGPRTA